MFSVLLGRYQQVEFLKSMENLRLPFKDSFKLSSKAAVPFYIHSRAPSPHIVSNTC